MRQLPKIGFIFYRRICEWHFLHMRSEHKSIFLYIFVRPIDTVHMSCPSRCWSSVSFFLLEPANVKINEWRNGRTTRALRSRLQPDNFLAMLVPHAARIAKNDLAAPQNYPKLANACIVHVRNSVQQKYPLKKINMIVRCLSCFVVMYCPVWSACVPVVLGSKASAVRENIRAPPRRNAQRWPLEARAQRALLRHCVQFGDDVIGHVIGHVWRHQTKSIAVWFQVIHCLLFCRQLFP